MEQLDRLWFLTVAKAWAEERIYLASWPIVERKDQTHRIGIVEGHPSVFTV